MYSTRTFDFGLRWTFFKIDKTSVQVSAVTKVTVPQSIIASSHINVKNDRTTRSIDKLAFKSV